MNLETDVRVLTLALIAVLIWWNDNPIFGGQIETQAAAFCLGALSAAGRLASPSATSGTGPEPSTEPRRRFT